MESMKVKITEMHDKILVKDSEVDYVILTCTSIISYSTISVRLHLHAAFQKKKQFCDTTHNNWYFR
jgi:hypothetical protein